MADKGLSEAETNRILTLMHSGLNYKQVIEFVETLIKTAKLQTLEDVWEAMKVECMANQGVYVTSIKGIVQDRKHGCDNLDTENSPECASAVCPLIKTLREAL